MPAVERDFGRPEVGGVRARTRVGARSFRARIDHHGHRRRHCRGRGRVGRDGGSDCRDECRARPDDAREHRRQHVRCPAPPRAALDGFDRGREARNKARARARARAQPGSVTKRTRRGEARQYFLRPNPQCPARGKRIQCRCCRRLRFHCQNRSRRASSRHTRAGDNLLPKCGRGCGRRKRETSLSRTGRRAGRARDLRHRQFVGHEQRNRSRHWSSIRRRGRKHKVRDANPDAHRNAVAQNPASWTPASPKRSSFTPMRSISDRYRLHTLRLSSPAYR